MKEIVCSLSAHIHEAHPWFAQAYPNAFIAIDGQGQETVMWEHSPAGARQPEFISLAFDDLQDSYFYIRHANTVTYGPANAIAGCFSAVRKNLTCVMVGLLKNGDVLKLEEGLINSLLTWRKGSYYIVPINSIMDPYQVIDQEVADDEQADRAKAASDGFAFISVTFNIIGDFQAMNKCCPCNPVNI